MRKAYHLRISASLRLRVYILMVASPLLLAASRAPADNFDLDAFMHAIEADAWPPSAVRADGEIVINGTDHDLRDQIVLVHRENNDLYVELRHSGLKALLLAGGEKSFLLPAADKAVKPFGLDEALAGSELTREDLQPFVAKRFPLPRIADQNDRQVTLTLVPRGGSHYSLLVTTFDREKKVPLKTLYYEQTLNNLVKMRQDSD